VNDVNNNQPTSVLFDTPYLLTGPFYVGYSLTYAAGDTVSVYTGKSGTITTNTSFCQYSGGNWYDYKTAWTENQHLKISPMISTLPTPDFTFSSPAAINTNVILDASSSKGVYGYKWTFTNANITTSNYFNEAIKYSNSGTYNVTLEVTGGCGNKKQLTKQIIINDNCISKPDATSSISGNINVLPGETDLTYSIPAVSGATSYEWILPTGITGTSTTNNIMVSITSSFKGGIIQVKAINLCGESTSKVTILTIAGLEKLNLNDSFNAYINNTTDELIINTTIDKTSSVIVTLLNSAGQEIYNQKYTSYIGEFTSKINVNTFETGVYILKMDTNQGVISKKFVIN
jgi:hypothetical protein